MTTLNIQHLGQIKQASLSFGDLTVLVGPQASGKSIALQVLKLMLDAGQVQQEMGRYGLDWGIVFRSFSIFILVRACVPSGSRKAHRSSGTAKPMDLVQIAKRKRPSRDETLFFIPAS